MKKSEKSEYMDHVLLNLQYDFARLCYLAKCKSGFLPDYAAQHEYNLLNDRLQKLFKACRLLSDEEIELLYLKYERRMTYQKIGRKLYLSKVSAYNKTRRALCKLYTAIYEE